MLTRSERRARDRAKLASLLRRLRRKSGLTYAEMRELEDYRARVALWRIGDKVRKAKR